MVAGTDDTNPGTEEKPFQTVQRAANAGTRLYFFFRPRAGWRLTRTKAGSAAWPDRAR